MTVEIQFYEGIKENTLPLVKLTKSKNGKTGTATFVFINPTSLQDVNCTIFPINGMYLIWNHKKIMTNDLDIFFREGKPFLIKSILIFKNSKEWFEFLSFMNYYSKETGLSFSEKNSCF